MRVGGVGKGCRIIEVGDLLYVSFFLSFFFVCGKKVSCLGGVVHGLIFFLCNGDGGWWLVMFDLTVSYHIIPGIETLLF